MQKIKNLVSSLTTNQKISIFIYFVAIIVTTLVANITIRGIVSIFGYSFLIVAVAVVIEIIKIILSNVLFFYDEVITTKLRKSVHRILKLMLGFALLITAVSLFTYMKNSFDGQLAEYKKLTTESIAEASTITVKEKQIEALAKQIDFSVERIRQLDESIESNNAEIDKLNAKSGIYVSLIRKLNDNNAVLQNSKENISNKIFGLDSTITNLRLEINQLAVNEATAINESKHNSDIATMLFISDVTNIDINILVSIFILVIIALIDPIILILYVIAGLIYNHTNYTPVTNEEDTIKETDSEVEYYDILPDIKEDNINDYV